MASAALGRGRRSQVGLLVACLALLAALIGVGVTVVVIEAQRVQNQREQEMSEEASLRAYELTDALKLTGPAARLAVGYAARNPGPGANTSNEGVLSRNFPLVMRDWRLIPSWGILSHIVFSYQGAGVVVATPNELPVPELARHGDELLQPSAGRTYDVTAYMLRTGQAFTTAHTANASRTLFAIAIPIFSNASSAADSWGWPANLSVRACLDGSAPCFNASTGTKWWGFVVFGIGRQEVEASPPLASLRSSGYGYIVSLRQDPPGLGIPELTRPTALLRYGGGGNQTGACPSGCSAAFATRRVDLYNLEITVQLCMLQPNTVSWEAPLIATVVIVSVLLVAAIGWVAFTWLRHSELLHALLPAPAVQQVSRALLHSKAPAARVVDADSPADKLIALLGDLLAHQQPDARDVVPLLAALKQRHNLYVPTAQDLRAQLVEAAGHDGEVAAALMATVAPVPLLPGSLGRGQGRGASTELLGGAQERGGDVDGLFSGRPEDFREALKAIVRDPSAGVLTHHKAKRAGSTGVARKSAHPSTAPDLTVDAGAACPPSPTPPTTFSLGGAFMLALAGASNNPRRRLSSSSTLPDSKRAEDLLDVATDDLVITTAVQPGTASSSVPLTVHCEALAAAPPSPSLTTRLEQLLMGALDLGGGFDAMEVADASCGHPLATLGFWVFTQSGVTQALRLPQDKLIAFLHAIEAGYSKRNPYHSATHAADVLQSVHALLHTGGLRVKYANSSNAVLACYLAALVHDYEHKGVTNDFLVNVRDELALRYNDKSPQENHHIAAAFRLLCADRFNFLAALPQSDFVFVRKMTIELVLATDMRQHFALNGAFASMHRLATSQGVDRVLKQFTPHSSPGASMAKPPPGPAAPAQQQQQQQRRAPRTSKTSANLRLPFAAVFGAGGSGSGFGRASARPELSEVDPETVLPSGAGGTAPQQSVRNSLDLPRGSPVSAGSHAHQSCGGSAAAHAALTVARASVEPRPPEVHVALAQPAAGGQPGGYRRAGSSGLGDLERCSSRSPGGGTVGGGGHPAPCPGPQDDTDRLLALQIMLKCSDLGHVAAAAHIHLKWVKALEEEMFKQGDREKELGVPVSPLCNREQGGVTQSQVGFFTAVCLPLFVNLSLRFPATAPMLEAVGRNYQLWSSLAKDKDKQRES